jgi:hypothetical protein
MRPTWTIRKGVLNMPTQLQYWIHHMKRGVFVSMGDPKEQLIAASIQGRYGLPIRWLEEEICKVLPTGYTPPSMEELYAILPDIYMIRERELMKVYRLYKSSYEEWLERWDKTDRPLADEEDLFFIDSHLVEYLTGFVAVWAYAVEEGLVDGYADPFSLLKELDEKRIVTKELMSHIQGTQLEQLFLEEWNPEVFKGGY